MTLQHRTCQNNTVYELNYHFLSILELKIFSQFVHVVVVVVVVVVVFLLLLLLLLLLELT